MVYSMKVIGLAMIGPKINNPNFLIQRYALVIARLKGAVILLEWINFTANWTISREIFVPLIGYIGGINFVCYLAAIIVG